MAKRSQNEAFGEVACTSAKRVNMETLETTPKLDNKLLGRIKKKIMALEKENLKEKCGESLERPQLDDLATIRIIDTGLESLSSLDFIVLHRPLLTERSAVDFRYRTMFHFANQLSEFNHVFEHVRYMALPREYGCNNGMMTFKGKSYAKAWELLGIAPRYGDDEYGITEHDEMEEDLYSDFAETDEDAEDE